MPFHVRLLRNSTQDHNSALQLTHAQYLEHAVTCKTWRERQLLQVFHRLVDPEPGNCHIRDSTEPLAWGSCFRSSSAAGRHEASLPVWIRYLMLNQGVALLGARFRSKSSPESGRGRIQIVQPRVDKHCGDHNSPSPMQRQSCSRRLDHSKLPDAVMAADHPRNRCTSPFLPGEANSAHGANSGSQRMTRRPSISWKEM